MKILLLGEYNASHFNLKQGLLALGHDVLLVGHGDGFKKRPADILFKQKFQVGFWFYLRRIVHVLSGIDLNSVNMAMQFRKHQDKFKNFDVVQLINERPFGCLPKTETKLLSYIFKHNKKVFLLSNGTDYISVKFALEGKYRYGILTPYFNKKGTRKDFLPALVYVSPGHKRLHEFVYHHIIGVFSSDLDYFLPLEGHPKHLGLMPHPICLENLQFQSLGTSEKIVIFHGINSRNYFKKGNDIFEEAINKLKSTHWDKVKIKTVRDLPHQKYLESYNDAHIILDMVYAYDQGYNALEGMAKGKVVFTGAEREWLDYYHLKEDEVAINALPDENQIYKKLCELVENPEKITTIGEAARQFVEKIHDAHLIATQSVKIWKDH